MVETPHRQSPSASALEEALLDVVIEIPRGGFLKRGAGAEVDFVSPLPCPFNYGAVPALLGGDGDLLDAVVLGPRLERGARVRVRAFGAVGLRDRGIYDDKLICAAHPPTPSVRRAVVAFFHLYALCKGGLNLWRRRTGRTACEGWGDARAAIDRAAPCPDAWGGPAVPY